MDGLMPERALSQDQIDDVFKHARKAGNDAPAQSVESYDFRRPDRIAKDQIRAVHALHENFAGKLASSLSAYLRAYVSANLISVEQLPFLEFAQCFPSPTCMVTLAMRPFEGSGVLEVNPSLVFPILERLMGGAGKGGPKVTRKVTEIEQTILNGLFRIILNDLKQAWSPVTAIDFSIETHETEPQILQILSPNEAVVAISMEVRVGETTGIMNIGIPSMVVKALRDRFNQQWMMRSRESTKQDHSRILNLIRKSRVDLEARLVGPLVRIEDLLDIKLNDVVVFDFPVGKPLDLYVNGRRKYSGQIVVMGRKRAFQIDQVNE